MNPSIVPERNLFAAGNSEFEKSHADKENIENKKGFRGSRLIKPIKNAVRCIADGICTAFRNIRSFLITACSPPCSCFRKEKCDASGQKSLSTVEKDAGQTQRDISSRQVELHEQPGLAEPVSQGADKQSILSGRVKLVSSDQGIEGFIKRQVFENPCGVVNSIDASGELLSGVGCAIKRLAGDDYARATREKQCSENPSDRLNYGQCSSHDFVLEDWSRPDSSIKEWCTIHNVLVPSASEPDFETHLKNSFLILFKEAVDRELEHIVLPMLGCGKAGGTGDRLARVLFTAAREFEARHPDAKMPEMILVGTPSPSGTQARADFESEWEALTQSAARQAPGSWIHRQSDASTHSDISSETVVNPESLSSGETPVVPPSVGAPERAFTAGADATDGSGKSLHGVGHVIKQPDDGSDHARVTREGQGKPKPQKRRAMGEVLRTNIRPVEETVRIYEELSTHTRRNSSYY